MLLLNLKIGSKVRLSCIDEEAELLVMNIALMNSVRLLVRHTDGKIQDIDLGMRSTNLDSKVILGGVTCRIFIGEWISKYHVKLCFEAPREFAVQRIVDGKPVEKKSKI